MPDTLTLIWIRLAALMVRCHSASCWQAVLSAQRPSGRIRPVSSASGMNSEGEIGPRSGWFHRASASTARRSEEHTSELQSLMRISYAVFCLKKKKKKKTSQYDEHSIKQLVVHKKKETRPVETYQYKI